MAYVENVRFGHDGFQIKVYYDFTRCELREDSAVTRAAVGQAQTMQVAQEAVGRPIQVGYDATRMVGPNG